MEYVLNKMLRIDLTVEGLIINIPSIEFIAIEGGIDEYLEFLRLFLTPKTFEQAYECLNRKFYVNSRHFDEMCEFSEKNNILKQNIDTVNAC